MLAETERGQRLPDVDSTQQLKMREQQRFFEEVFQHDVDVYLSSAHLCIRDYKRPPIGSISSMEVNVDLLDQMELTDIADQDTLDVFFSSGGEEADLDTKPRLSSTSSNSSCDSQTTNANGRNTPVVRSDDEETNTGTLKRREKVKSQTPSSSSDKALSSLQVTTV
uniref:Si:ch211-253b8.5 n=1 Tax=Labrus bergylta TaxID=56723 RepID=A0A3Q3FP73_9LABR